MSLRPGKGSKQYQEDGGAGAVGGYNKVPPPAIPALQTMQTTNGSMDLSSSGRHGNGGASAQSPYRAATTTTNVTPRASARSISHSINNYASKLPPSPYLGGAGSPTSPYAPKSPYKVGGTAATTTTATSGYFSPSPPPKRPTVNSTSSGGSTSPYASPRPKIPSSPSPYRVAYSQPPQQSPTPLAAAAHSYNNNPEDGYYKEKKIIKKPSLPVQLGWMLLRHWSWCIIVFLLVQLVRVRLPQRELLQLTGVHRWSHVPERYRQLQHEADTLRHQVHDVQTRSQEERRQSEQKVQQLYAQLQSLQQQDHSSRPEDLAKLERAEKREEAWLKQVQLLQQATTRESRRVVTEKFGPGPHYVQISITLPHLEESDMYQSFVIEMAPLESMPHAVHLFLEQVAHNLWNHAWFYVNGPHVLQGGPQANEDELLDDDDERTIALRPFRERQLSTLAFPEYSEDYPHEQYTLGFTGRPGGPDFYINKGNNTIAHGPGGQFHHELDEFADPCFAKVVKQYESVIETMIRSPTIMDPQSEYAFFLEEPIYITKMEIVDDPLHPKPKLFPTSKSSQPQDENDNEYDDDSTKGNDSFTDEQLDKLMGQFLEAMHSSDGLEFVEKQLQSERSPYGGAGIWEALGENNDKATAAKLLEALSEARQRHRKPHKGRKKAETEQAVASNKNSNERSQKSTAKKDMPADRKEKKATGTKENQPDKPDAVAAAGGAAKGMETNPVDSLRSSRRKPMKRRYKPNIEHAVQP